MALLDSRLDSSGILTVCVMAFLLVFGDELKFTWIYAISSANTVTHHRSNVHFSMLAQVRRPVGFVVYINNLHHSWPLAFLLVFGVVG